MSLTYHQIVERLEAIEEDLAGLDESVADEYHRAKRDFEFEWAKAYIDTDGTVEERRQKTIKALYRSDAYKRLVMAEAGYEGFRAAQRTLETRASIGQSLLRAHTREAPQNGAQPQWSGG